MILVCTTTDVLLCPFRGGKAPCYRICRRHFQKMKKLIAHGSCFQVLDVERKLSGVSLDVNLYKAGVVGD